jgi:hypothetical protein
LAQLPGHLQLPQCGRWRPPQRPAPDQLDTPPNAAETRHRQARGGQRRDAPARRCRGRLPEIGGLRRRSCRSSSAASWSFREAVIEGRPLSLTRVRSLLTVRLILTWGRHEIVSEESTLLLVLRKVRA